VAVVFVPRSERWQGVLGEVFEVEEQCTRPVSAIICGIGGWEGANMVREEGGVEGISETKGSRAHFRSKHTGTPPKHTQKGRSPRFARARGHHPMRDSHLP
jgi:hypothetical protein